MRISDWSSDVCSTDLSVQKPGISFRPGFPAGDGRAHSCKVIFAPGALSDPADHATVNALQRAGDIARPVRAKEGGDGAKLVRPAVAAGGNAGLRLAADRVRRPRFALRLGGIEGGDRSEEHTSELQSL